MPIKLLHLGCADDIRAGFDNLDPKINGWTFESGLPYTNESVDGITISHALMYVSMGDWLAVFHEFWRVLEWHGVVRITEDDVTSPTSARFRQLYNGAKAATGPELVREYLEGVGFTTQRCAFNKTWFRDDSLLIVHRERTPNYVFYMEGRKDKA